GTLRFYWGESGSTPAIEISVIYNSSGSFRIKRYVYDPNDSRRAQTNFSNDPSCGDKSFGGKDFAFCTDSLTLPAGTKYMAKVRLLFNSTSQPVGVRGSANLPLQGSCFPVTATVQESGVTKKYEECQLFGATSPIFDNLLYSGGGLVQ
ncbi:hypothetical protein KKA69_02005, partial [Patescibacteria group bacterium]|nr:hypothetical protein [Patescibacteria group bacterium]